MGKLIRVGFGKDVLLNSRSLLDADSWVSILHFLTQERTRSCFPDKGLDAVCHLSGEPAQKSPSLMSLLNLGGDQYRMRPLGDGEPNSKDK